MIIPTISNSNNYRIYHNHNQYSISPRFNSSYQGSTFPTDHSNRRFHTPIRPTTPMAWNPLPCKELTPSPVATRLPCHTKIHCLTNNNSSSKYMNSKRHSPSIP